MKENTSFTKAERELRSEFREKINTAESTEDVKKIFAHTVAKLFGNVLAEPSIYKRLEHEDIQLDPKKEEGYTLSDRVLDLKDFMSIWTHSDLAPIVERFASIALKRHKHLEHHPDKTEVKIYPTPGPRGSQRAQ